MSPDWPPVSGPSPRDALSAPARVVASAFDARRGFGFAFVLRRDGFRAAFLGRRDAARALDFRFAAADRRRTGFFSFLRVVAFVFRAANFRAAGFFLRRAGGFRAMGGLYTGDEGRRGGSAPRGQTKPE